MSKQCLVLRLLLLLSVALGAQAMADGSKGASSQPLGLRLGMSEEAAHKRLKKIATQKKEEKEEGEGEQEVWILKRDEKLNYLITRFDEKHRLVLITVVARPTQVRYADIGDLNDATKATDGLNYSYKWKVAATKQQPVFLIIARGSSAEFLTSYSVYPTR
ncbi:MAG: hypothetical protein ACRD9S_13225 [Pyrinomonadaceae bacterium]